ncbi:secreted protein containing DUF1588 [Rhodopirellula maiorica SM1]|uniref:Secreted protein containing DUF1588 n=1 Tax=Rhodopirellula maiorica SM1 TaxID=1265738 RepID=M5RU29_9BACT|nr:secreted protein containing DUF1588 [Rhodopirellula maiorica SM1]
MALGTAGRLLAVILLALVASSVAADQSEKEWSKAYEATILPLMKSHCLDCHGEKDAEGEFNIAQFTSGSMAVKHRDSFERIVKRIELGEMPPEDSEGFTAEQKQAILTWFDNRPKQKLCDELASEATQKWYRGNVMSRRLTRSEYRYAIEDLVGTPLPDSTSLPSDGSGGEGFDTNGDSLFLSPIHLESYLKAADWAASKWLSTNAPKPVAQSGDAALGRKSIREIVQRFARRAWRRPITEPEVDRLMTLYDAAIGRASPETEADDAAGVKAMSQPLKAILLSPHFLFVVEQESPEGGVQRLTAHELAMRLSLFIWSSIPDDALAQLADSGEILSDDTVRSQVARMLADPKSNRLGENFGLQWLGLTDLKSKTPDQEVFPDFDNALLADMQREASVYVSDIFQHDRRLLDLIDGDHVILNQRLAEHYGLADAVLKDNAETASSWERIQVDDGRRGGVMTLGAVLVRTSHSRRTSPVLRGQWILSEVIGSPVPPPPPGVPPLEETSGEDEVATLREQLEIHRKNPACASCHNRMDPLGFGLENFDALGRWRTMDGESPIDASGRLPSGQTFSGPAELKSLMAKRADEFRKHFVKNCSDSLWDDPLIDLMIVS